MTKFDDTYNKQFDNADRNELLWRALDKAVLQGKLRPDAVQLLHGLYADKCKVVDGDVTLLNLDLPEAVDAIIERMPLVQLPKDDPTVNERERVEQEALQGSVAAHGAMWKRFVAESGGNEKLGDAKYQLWCAANKAKPGLNAAVNGAEKSVGDLDAADLVKIGASKNPFTKAGWNISKQGSAYRADPALAARLAAAAGVTIGSTKPVM